MKIFGEQVIILLIFDKNHIQNQYAYCLDQNFKSIAKEYIERRHGEPFKFLFLPKMGLLGSQAVLEKKVQF